VPPTPELKRRGVLGPDDQLRSAELEGFVYPERQETREAWTQPRLDGSIDLPSRTRQESLDPAEREQQALEVLGLTPGYDQPDLPLQVTEIAEYNCNRQAEIDERRSMRVPAEEPDEMDLGEAWTLLAERRRDAVIQPPSHRSRPPRWPGMRGVYGHVTPAMRAALTTMLQERWEASLRERAQLSPRSIVPVLDAFLVAQRESQTKIGSHFAPKIGHQRADRFAQRRKNGY
jgi:hypothetical protein